MTDDKFLLEQRQVLGHFIKATRKALSLTQADLADKCGVTTSTIVKIELGKFNYSVDLLVKIGQALGFELELKQTLDPYTLEAFEHDSYLLTQNSTGISCYFEYGKFNESLKINIPPGLRIGIQEAVDVMANMGRWIHKNHPDKL